MTRTIRWGIIGTGDVAEFKSGPAFYAAENSQLVAVMNRTKAKAVDFASRHGEPEVFDTAEALVQSSNVDAVYIGTAPDSHLSLTELSAKYGKHVLCEKPMARSIEECQAMIDICSAEGVSLSIAYYRRYFPVVQKLKELIDSGCIGDVLHVSAITTAPFHLSMDVWRLDASVSGGGFLMDMGVHRFDLFSYLCGPPKSVTGFASAHGWAQEVDNSASVSIEFQNGVLGSAVFHWNTSLESDQLSVIGSKGGLLIEDLSGAGRLSLRSEQENQTWELPSSKPVHLELVKRVNDHLLGNRENPCSGESAIYANEMASALY